MRIGLPPSRGRTGWLRGRLAAAPASHHPHRRAAAIDGGATLRQRLRRRLARRRTIAELGEGAGHLVDPV
jgi:hypothetical protein